MIPDSRADNAKISLDDALMSVLAMFVLKDPSLLAFDKRRREEPENLHTVLGITTIPCDSQMRAILDPLALVFLRAAFCTVFREVQRGKDFQKMAYYDGHYLLSGDGPHIRDLQRHNLRFILGVKPGDHVALFAELHEAVAAGKASEVSFLDPKDRKTGHFFRFFNQVLLNKSNHD